MSELPAARTVLVTGASSGIGRCVVTRLAQQGHRVFAGARKAQDLAALGAIDRVTALELDVSDPAQIAAAVQRVQAAGYGLDGLVNNAGVGGLGPLHTWTDGEMLQLFDTNVFGPQRMCRAFGDLLLARRGRVVHIGSQGGSITSRWFGPYTMSKHALEAMAQSQREELAPHGVGVSIVQPGAVATTISDTGAPGTRARFERAMPPFDIEAVAVLRGMAQPTAHRADEPESASNRVHATPETVAVAVEHALFSAAPRARYLVGSRWEGMRVVDALLTKLLDANEGTNMQLSRAELVALLQTRFDARP